VSSIFFPRLAALALVLWSGMAAAETLRVGASTTVYRDLVQQIDARGTTVDRLPESRDGVAADLRHFAFIVCDDTTHDVQILAAARRAGRPVVLLKSIIGDRSTSRPWFNTPAMAEFALEIATALGRENPAERAVFDVNAAHFRASLVAIDRRFDEVSKLYANSRVFLADDHSEGLAARLRFKVQNPAYVAALKTGVPQPENLLAPLLRAISNRNASILIYDRGKTSAATKQLISAAEDAAIPVVGLTTDLPSGLSYQQWMIRQINTVRGALNEAAP
jgi:zinc/manganese transport system substrate-binding protein